MCAPRFCRMQLFRLRVVRRLVCAPSVKRGGGNIEINIHWVYFEHLSLRARRFNAACPPLRPSTHPSIHPPIIAVVLNALGRGRDLFSASLMHRFNGALILFSAPQGLLRSVMCASIVCSLPISRHISYLQSGSQMRFNAGKKKNKNKKKMDVVADIVLLCLLRVQISLMQSAVSIVNTMKNGKYINAKLLNHVIKNEFTLPPPEQNVSENICMLKYAKFEYFE